LTAWSRAVLWLTKPAALRLQIPALSAEMRSYRRRVLLSLVGLGVLLSVGLGLAAVNGWVGAWLGLILVWAGAIWGLVINEARIRVLPYLQLLEEAYEGENRVYVADSKLSQPRLSVGNVMGEMREYQLREVNAGAGLDWNTEAGRQNLAATICADALGDKTVEGEVNLGEQLVQGFASELAVFLFRRKVGGQIELRENFSTTRRAVINFIAGRL
jgi:hypothetical protein